MKIKINSTLCADFGSFQAGKVVDLPNDIANDLIKNGYAVSVEPPAPKPVPPKPQPKPEPKPVETNIAPVPVVETADVVKPKVVKGAK